MNDTIKKQDEEERRSLQKYIFELEEIQEKAEELSHEHEQLKHSQDLLLAILRGTIHGICLLRDRRFVWCNEAFTDILGWKREELIGKTTRIIYPNTEEYKRAGEITYGKSRPSGLIAYEYEYAHKKGYRVPCLVTGRALDNNNLSKGHVFSFTDITERKQAREELERKITELNSFLNNIPDMAWIKDTDSHLIAVNRAFAETVGTEPEFLTNNTCEVCFGKEAAKKFREDDLMVMKGKRQVIIEEKIVDSENNDVWLETIKSPIMDKTGKPMGTAGIARDITKHKEIEAALKESEGRLRAILDNSTAVIYLKDTKGRYLFINKRYESLFHVSNEQIKGKTDYDIFPEKVAEKFQANDREILKQNRAVEFEETAPHEDGMHSYITIKFPLHENKGKAYAVCGMSTDISDRKQAEVSLKQAYQELKTTQAQLVQSGKLASIGELASGVAHELNQPLMVIRSMAQLVRRSIGKTSLSINELLEQFEPVERNTKRMMNIINHLRTFSRQSDSEFREVDANKIINDAFLMIGEQLRLHNIKVEKNLQEDLPKVKGDASQLEQVILNLITNARDAIEMRDEGRGTRDEGGGTSDEGRRMKDDSVNGRNGFRGMLEITTRMGETPNQQSKGFIEILVRDTGGGIPADKIDKIFDPFFTTKEVGKGTGLGLSISYGIIQDHKGEIEVAETGPEGTTFRIKLPTLNIQLP